MMTTRLLTMLLCLIPPSLAEAVCVIMPLDYYLKEASVTALFRGTVREVKRVPAGQIVTVDVDRVWKGRVLRSTVVYHDLTSEEADPMAIGKAYVIFTHRLTMTERKAFSLDAKVDALGAGGCAVNDPEGYGKDIVGSARGYSPAAP